MGLRQQIVNAIKLRFEGITIANGYNTDIGKTVDEWIAYDPEDVDLDLERISVRDAICRKTEPDEIDDNTAGRHYKLLTVYVFVMNGGTTTPEILRMKIEDVLKAIGEDETWGGIAIGTELEGDETGISQKRRKLGETRITIMVRYSVPRWTD